MCKLATKTLFSLALLAASVCAKSSDLRALPDIAINVGAERSANAPATLMAAKPSGNWVLLVLNSRLTGSEAYLSSLKADGFDGDKLVVLLVSDTALAQNWIDREVMPAKARLASGELLTVLNGLSLPGTPAFYGITAEGKIAWQHLGYGKNPGERLVRIWDWVKRPIAAPKNSAVGKP
jgi:hypothetical protein